MYEIRRGGGDDVAVATARAPRAKAAAASRVEPMTPIDGTSAIIKSKRRACMRSTN